jgi:hypothetical protein
MEGSEMKKRGEEAESYSFMSVGRDGVSELLPSSCLLFIPQVIYMSVDSHGGMILTGEAEELEEKPVAVPLCTPQIPY